MTTKKFTAQEEVIKNFIRADAPPLTLLDVGVGPKSEYFTLLEHYPDMRVIGLEPYTPLFEELKHKFPGALLPYAASDTPGTATFFVHEGNAEASGLIPYDREAKSAEQFEVPVVTLDALDHHLGKPQRILLWMDIEGAELKALKGATKLIESGRVRWVNVEARAHWNGKSGGCEESELDRYFAKRNFNKVFIYNHHGATGHHDVVYMHKDELLPEAGYILGKKCEKKMGITLDLPAPPKPVKGMKARVKEFFLRKAA